MTKDATGEAALAKAETVWLTYLVWILILIIGSVLLWQVEKVSSFPKEYVTKAEHSRDIQDMKDYIRAEIKPDLTEIRTDLKQHLQDKR